LNDPDAEFELYSKLDEIGGVESTIRKLIDMMRAANREAQPVGFISEKHGPVLYGESIGLPVGTHFYTSLPAPAVPEESLINAHSRQQFEQEYSSLYGTPCTVLKTLRDGDDYMETDGDRVARCWAMWNACRAAMLAAPDGGNEK
jgi:hypothetical protein